MKKIIIIVISFIAAFVVSLLSGLEDIYVLLLFGGINSLLTFLGLFFFDNKNSRNTKSLTRVNSGDSLSKDVDTKKHLKQILQNAIQLNDAL